MTRANARFGATDSSGASYDGQALLNEPLIPPSREQYRAAALTVVEHAGDDAGMVLEMLGIGVEQVYG